MEVAWDPFTRDANIGKTALRRLITSSALRIRPGESDLHELESTDGNRFVYRSLGRVQIAFWEWGVVWCRVVEDTPALGNQQGLDLSTPTFLVRQLRAYLQAHPQGDTPALVFGAALGNDDFHRQPEHRDIVSRTAASHGTWNSPNTGDGQPKQPWSPPLQLEWSITAPGCRSATA